MANKYIHRIYGIVLSVVAVIAGVCLIAACISINSIGDRPFSAEAVKTAFATIAIPVYLCVALVIGGFILDGFLAKPTEKSIVPKQHAAMLEKYYRNDPSLKNSRGRKNRLIHRSIALGLLVIGSVVFLSYGLNGANFDTHDITNSMKNAMFVLLPCMAVPFGYAVFAAYYAKVSMARELDALRNAGATPDRSLAPVDRRLLWIRWAILGIGIVLLVVGFVSGGTEDVLTKAVNICTECVGLG